MLLAILLIEYMSYSEEIPEHNRVFCNNIR